MTRANYCVIRLIPDLARNEPLNIGTVAWSNGRAALKVDDDALARALQWAPNLIEEAFDGYADYLAEKVLADWPSSDDRCMAYLAETLRIPTLTTEPLYLRLDDSEAIDRALEQSVEVLSEQLVRLRRRWSPRSRGLADPVRRRLGPLIHAERIAPDYKLTRTQSGRERTVSFFANSGTQVALDVLTFRANAKEQGIFDKADQQVTKVNDIQAGQQRVDYFVYLPLD